MIINKCFLDMDGVLDDFLGSASLAHGRPLPYDRPENMGVFDVEKLWQMSDKEFWAPINAIPDFWANMRKTDEADRIVDLATRIFGEKNVAILTAPHTSGDCIPGKYRWIHRHFPQFDHRIIFAKAKEFLAGPGRYLIDDWDRNVEDFNKAGGWGILVPRPWNNGWDLRGPVVEHIEAQLEGVI